MLLKCFVDEKCWNIVISEESEFLLIFKMCIYLSADLED